MVAFANYTVSKIEPESLLLQPSALTGGGRDGFFCGNNAVNKWDLLGMEPGEIIYNEFSDWGWIDNWEGPIDPAWKDMGGGRYIDEARHVQIVVRGPLQASGLYNEYDQDDPAGGLNYGADWDEPEDLTAWLTRTNAEFDAMDAQNYAIFGDVPSGNVTIGTPVVVDPNSIGTSITNSPFAQTANYSCVPTAARTVVTTVTGTDPGDVAMKNQVATAQGNPGQNWNTTGVATLTYASTVSTVLTNNGVRPTVTPNVSYSGASPTATSLALNVASSSSPSIVVVSLPNNGGLHAITVQYQSRSATFVVNNLTGSGGSTTYSWSTFGSGSLPRNQGNYTIIPQFPIVTGDPGP